MLQINYLQQVSATLKATINHLINKQVADIADKIKKYSRERLSTPNFRYSQRITFVYHTSRF